MSLPSLPTSAKCELRLAAPLAPMTPVVDSLDDARQVAAARLLWERGADVSPASSPVPGAREPAALDLWADRASVAAFDFESSRTRACLASRRAMISPTRPAITWPAPEAPLRHAQPRVSITRDPTISPGRRLAPRASRRRSIDPRSDRLRFPRRVGASCTPTFQIRHRHRQAVLVVRSRQVGVAGVARTDRACFGPGAVRSPAVQASSGSDCRREPPR
jgi:hypothetical protein